VTPAPTVATLLRSPAWRDRVRVLAGAVPRDAVRGIRLLSPDEHPADAAGQVLVLVGALRDGPASWRVDALLRRAADAGALAVLLSGEADLAPPTRLLCSRLSVCALGTSAPVLALAAEAAVQVAEPEVARARALLQVQTALAEGRVATPEALVRLLTDVLDAPVTLLDAAGGPLTGPPVDSPRLAEPVLQVRTAGATTSVARPVLLPGVRASQRWLVAGVPASSPEAVVLATTLLAAGAAALSGWLATQRLGLERDARSRAGLLADVLRVSGEPSAELRRRSSTAGWSLEGWHVGVRVGTVASVDTAGLRDDVVRTFADAGVDAVVVEHGDGWSGWTTTTREPTAEQVRALADVLRRAHRGLQGLTRCWTGVGRPHPGPTGITRTLEEAADAARLAAGRPEQGHFLHVDQLGMAQTLLAWTRTSTFEPAARGLLAPLGDPDGDLVRTLAVFLDAESSLTETAAVLGIHRNTVAARITRIASLLAVDLTDRDQRLALHLACRAVALG